MSLLHRFLSITGWLLRRDRAEQQLDEELRAFIELAAAEKIREGYTPDEARRLAAVELGGLEQVKERVRTSRHGAGLDEIGRDVRYAVRVFARSPGFTAIVVMTLALGIGANTAIFSLIEALMLRQLPVRNPQELVQLKIGDDWAGFSFSYAIVRALADRRDIFAGVAGFSGLTFDIGASGSVSRVPGAVVTGEYYETLGLTSVIGRLLTRNDDEPAAPLAAVISYGYWERQFARRPDALGQTLLVNGLPVAVVGVSPRGFVGANVGAIADITMPVAALPRINPAAAPLLGPGNFWLRVLARPATGLSAPAARARLSAVWPHMADDVISPRWSATRRKAMAAATLQLTPGATGWTYLRETYRKPLWVLMAAVGLVLLIACANVASLLLARASARRREIAVRLAVGAGRARIMRQLLIESILLSSIGAAVGVELAWLSSRFIVDLISTGPVPVVFDLTPNGMVLVFTSAVAVLTGVLFGVVPAFQSTADGPASVLKEDTRTSVARSRVLPTLVSAQVALSLVLLVGAGLFVRTLRNLQDFDPGFTRDGVLLVDFEGRRTAIPREVMDVIEGVPGVLSASLSTHTPLSGSVWSDPAVPSGQPLPERDTAYFVGAGPRFFSTMKIQLPAGREFDAHDSADSPGVAIINERFAQRYFPGTNPIGRHLAAKVRGQTRDLEIVGLAKNTSAAGLRRNVPATVYVAYAQLTGDFPTTIGIRATGSIARTASAVQQALQSRLPGTPIEVRPLSAQVEATMVQERVMATLGSAFGLLALILACIGLYGLLSYTVVRRTKEIGIRMALGAQRPSVVALVLRGAARLVLTGVVVGVPVAWAASRWVESMLFGLKPTDPATLVGSVVVLAVAAQVAAYLPAWRASRVDPLTALRYE